MMSGTVLNISSTNPNKKFMYLFDSALANPTIAPRIVPMVMATTDIYIVLSTPCRINGTSFIDSGVNKLMICRL